MHIGIVGKGKMGSDLFYYFLKFGDKLTLICRRKEEINELKKIIDKKINKLKNMDISVNQLMKK